jgi:hypothetical protein
MRRVVVMSTLVAAVSGCYVYTAAPPVPAAGTHLVLELNDRGRTGLGDSIGSGAKTVEGTTVASTDSAYSLMVSRVGYLNRQANDWTGERLVIPRMFVSNVQQRTFSKGRTGVAAALVTAAVAGFIASRGLLGSGTGANPDPGGGGKVSSRSTN